MENRDLKLLQAVSLFSQLSGNDKAKIIGLIKDLVLHGESDPSARPKED